MPVNKNLRTASSTSNMEARTKFHHSDTGRHVELINFVMHFGNWTSQRRLIIYSPLIPLTRRFSSSERKKKPQKPAFEGWSKKQTQDENLHNPKIGKFTSTLRLIIRNLNGIPSKKSNRQKNSKKSVKNKHSGANSSDPVKNKTNIGTCCTDSRSLEFDHVKNNVIPLKNLSSTCWLI